MAWEVDVKKGTAMVGSTKREGFTLMRDRKRGLVVFHVSDERLDQQMASSPVRVNDQFVVEEEAFEPAETWSRRQESNL